MTYAMPTTPIPSQDSTKTRDPRVITTQFGNGYQQRALDGLNAIQDSWNLIWDSLVLTDLQTFTAFFDSCYGVQYFTWQDPEDLVTKKWVQNGAYTIQPVSGNVYQLTVPIIQVFDL